MSKPVCDATLAGVYVGSCSSDHVEVWHGYATPAHACGKHAQYNIQDVFNGHANRENGVTP